MIEVKNVSKSFKKEISRTKKESFYADYDISFTAENGKILGILGPNGAGKTTLLRMISGIMKPTEGTITIDNMNYKHNSVEIKKEISFLTGNTKLYKELSPYELLSLCGEYYGLSKNQIESQIKKLTSKFDLSSFLYQRINNLSTGQYQRVSLARCALHEPKYYIFDEVTSGLDIILSQNVLNFIKDERKKGKCIIYSTHYMEEAENICDEVLLIHNGKIVAYDTPKNIINNTKTTNLRDAFFSVIGDKNE